MKELTEEKPKIKPDSSFDNTCTDLDEDCIDYENGTYSDGTPRKYEICQSFNPECGICPFVNRSN